MIDYDVIWCDCGTDAITVWHDPDDQFVELCMWSQGTRGNAMTGYFGWRQRLLGAWNWLRGRPHTDMVVLTPAEAARLRKALAHRTEDEPA